ncbi:hypothetical protein M2408_004750 [Sphingobacterium sp. BIGb0165]|nr:hypothetical protein [Sphingobacterium sp. BIGb0165]
MRLMAYFRNAMTRFIDLNDGDGVDFIPINKA